MELQLGLQNMANVFPHVLISSAHANFHACALEYVHTYIQAPQHYVSALQCRDKKRTNADGSICMSIITVPQERF